MKVEIKGFLKQVSAPIEKESFTFQDILIERPVHDGFDGKLLYTEFYPAYIANDRIKELDADALVDKKVIATCYLSSSKAENDEGTRYFLRLKVKDLKELS